MEHTDSRRSLAVLFLAGKTRRTTAAAFRLFQELSGRYVLLHTLAFVNCPYLFRFHFTSISLKPSPL